MTARASSARPLSDRIRRRLRSDLVVPLVRHVVGPVRRMRNAGRAYRPVFVTGVMGSGTTLLAFSLGARYDCAAVIAESGREMPEDSFLHVPHPNHCASVAAYQARLRPDPSWSVEAGRESLLELYRSQARGPADVVIDKGPNANLVRAPFLRECFPEAHFVVVFRDPVASVEGFRRKWARFREDPLEESIRFYADLHERFLHDADGLGGRVTFVAYEILTAHHDAVLEALGRRLGLEPARRRRRLETRANVEGQGIRNVRRGRIELDPDANRKSYERLSPQEIGAIRERLDPLYAKLEAASLLRSAAP